MRGISERNVEIVRTAFEAYMRGDLDEALSYADPEIIWNPVEEAPGEGPDAMRANLARWESNWDEYEAIPEEFMEAGERVVVTTRFRGTGKGSGLEVEARLYEVFTLRNGKVVRMDEFTERSEALEAAGLRQ